MNKIPTQVNEGDLINSATLIEPQEYYSEDKDNIVWALNKLFPHIKRWLDIEATDYRLTYYNPFESINSDINIKTHNDVVSLSVTPEINKPDIPDIPDVEEPEGEKPPRSMETSTGLQFTVEAKGAEITDTSFSVWVYGEIGQTVWELYKDDVLVVSPTVNTIGATIGQGMLYDMVTIPITDRAINNYTLKTLADRTCIAAKSTFQGPNHIQSYVVTAFDNYVSHPTFQLHQSSLQVPAELPKHITSAEYMFKYCQAFNQDITGWDVSNITDMDSMFQDCYLFDQPIGNWNVSNVTNMDYMFYGAKVFNKPVSSWDTSNVTSMREMFRDAFKFNQDISLWNVSNVTNMRGMFQDNGVFNQDISGWNTAKVTDMYRFLYKTYAFNQDLSQWCVPLIPVEPSQFARDVVLWTLPKPVWGTCPRGEDGKPPLGLSFTIFSPVGFQDSSKITLNVTDIAPDWKLNLDGVLLASNEVVSEDITVSVAGAVTSLTFNKGDIGTNEYTLLGKASEITVMYRGFYSNTTFHVTAFSPYIPVYKFNTHVLSLLVPDTLPKHITKLDNMFDNARSFNQNINGWDTSHVTSMVETFSNAVKFNQPLDNWNTGKVVSMNSMFYKAERFNQDLSSWWTISVTDINNMFASAAKFNGNLAGWDTSNVIDMTGAFDSAAAFNQPIGNWNTSKVEHMWGMFYYAEVFNQDLSAWDTSKVQYMQGMFENALMFNQDLSSWCVSNIPTYPSKFHTPELNVWTLPKPVWGTCPRGENIAA